MTTDDDNAYDRREALGEVAADLWGDEDEYWNFDPAKED